MKEPRIYVGTFAKYNAGNLDGRWLEMRDFENAEDFYLAARALHSDEVDPELMFSEAENIPARMISESYLSDAFFDWMELSPREREVVEVYCENVYDREDRFDWILENCLGVYDDKADWAEELLLSTDIVPKGLVGYVDYDKYARDAEWNGDMLFVRRNGHTYAFNNA